MKKSWKYDFGEEIFIYPDILGLTWAKAQKVLNEYSILNYSVIVTHQPRKKIKRPEDHFRVVKSDFSKEPLEVVLCPIKEFELQDSK